MKRCIKILFGELDFRSFKVMEEKVDMKILITGANGYLGKGVVRQLLNEIIML